MFKNINIDVFLISCIIGGIIGGISSILFNELLINPEEKDLSCSICLEPIKSGWGADILPCGHPFHNNCLDEWYYQSVENGKNPRSISCPLCRQECKAKLILINYVPELAYTKN